MPALEAQNMLQDKHKLQYPLLASHEDSSNTAPQSTSLKIWVLHDLSLQRSSLLACPYCRIFGKDHSRKLVQDSYKSPSFSLFFCKDQVARIVGYTCLITINSSRSRPLASRLIQQTVLRSSSEGTLKKKVRVLVQVWELAYPWPYIIIPSARQPSIQKPRQPIYIQYLLLTPIQ